MKGDDYEMAELSVITEVGDLGLGIDPISKEDLEKINESPSFFDDEKAKKEK